LHCFFDFTQDISHLLLTHSSTSKFIYIANHTLSHVLRHNGTVIAQKDENSVLAKQAKLYHRFWDTC